MARISEETIRRVADATDIVDLIGSYFPLKRAGSNYRALCPFHNEKTPSFMVTPSRQSFRCFGCGAGGGVFRFVMDYERIPFHEAVRRLASKAGIPVLEEAGGSSDDRAHYQRRRLLALHAEAAAWFHANLLKSPDAEPARTYLRARGLDAEIAKSWLLGYAPDSWEAIMDFLGSKKFTRGEIIASGLVTSREESPEAGRIYARFRGRVMFPIRNDYGEVIAFSGRILAAEAKAAKYVNSPETPLFTKGRILYALDKSKRALIEAREAVVCEGQIDAIRAYEAGVRNVIAPQGTAFTHDQARLLSRFVESVVLCFDSDKAGQEAASRSIPALLENGLAVRMVRLPEGMDPDSLIQSEGAESFRERIAAAPDFFDHAVQRALEAGVTGNASRLAAATRKLGGWISLMKDPVARDAVIGRATTRLGISQEAFRAQMRQARPQSAHSMEGGEEEPADPDAGPPLVLSETLKILCRHALMDPESRAWLLKNDTGEASKFEEGGILLEQIVRFQGPLETPGDLAAFAATLTPRVERAWAAIDISRPGQDLLEATQGYWRGLKLMSLKAQIEANKARLRDPDTPSAERLSLQQDIVDLNRQIQSQA